MNKIKKPISAAEIRALLGAPDDTWGEGDRNHCSRGQKAIWRYGTSGHTSLATLAEVWIDHQGHGLAVFGYGTPPAEDVIAEKELRRLLPILDAVSPYSAGADYNPRTVICAVNELQRRSPRQSLKRMSTT